MTKYFLKELVNSPVRIKTGKPLVFAHVLNNTGVLEVDVDKEPELAAELARSVGKLGLSEITLEKFEAFKKKLPLPERKPSLPKLRLSEQDNDPFRKPGSTVITPVPLPAAVMLQGSVPPVAAPESAPPAADPSPAEPVAAKGEFKARTAKASQAKAKSKAR